MREFVFLLRPCLWDESSLDLGGPPGSQATAQLTHTDFSPTRRGRDLVEIPFTGQGSLTIGGFRAHDYFGDGSFYLLDSPGHAVGHLCGLARTTQGGGPEDDTFVLLGGDVCHYAGILRPSEHLPVPDTISPHPCSPHGVGSLCPGHAWEELQASRGRKPTDTLFDMTFGADIPLATRTVGKLQELDCLENVLVVIAHDSSIRDRAPHFPESLNGWKANGLGERVRWAFFRDLEHYWREKGLAE